MKSAESFQSEAVPYECLIIDSSWRNILHAAYTSLRSPGNRSEIFSRVQQKWMIPGDMRPVLPCLSVRSCFDIYLSVKRFPPGSEVIMSAINIPDMARIVRHHGLKIVTVDITMETTAPKEEWLESLITGKTVAIILSHIYGRYFDMEPFVKIAQKHRVDLIEDCAEGFSGFQTFGHPEADLSLFSFGAIKYFTAFGGGVAKIKRPELFGQMKALFDSYAVQTHSEYLYKVMKYAIVYTLLNKQNVNRVSRKVACMLNFDVESLVIGSLRGYPEKLMTNIRKRPSTALLNMMLSRFCDFSSAEFELANLKGEYVEKRLPESVTKVGDKAFVKNYWLFPIVVENPEEVLKSLKAVGIQAYRGATQLTVLEPDNVDAPEHRLQSFITRYPHEARFLIDHVVYLPVHKLVPFSALDQICHAVHAVMETQSKSSAPSHLLAEHGYKLKLQSKL